MIVIYYANRAEKSILDPIKTELDRRGLKNLYVDLSFVVKDIDEDKNLSKVYDYVFNQLEKIPEIHSGIVIGDRREIMFASLAMFVKDINLIQLAAGDLSEEISLVDDYFRHLITILSNRQICFTPRSKEKSEEIRSALNLPSKSEYFPNPTLSDIDIKNVVRNSTKIYDLVLIHPQSLSEIETSRDAEEVCSKIDRKIETVIVKGNKDKNFEILYDTWESLGSNDNIHVMNSLKKEYFIDLLANCNRFITNSSCAYYEAPFFLDADQIVKIGRRNKNREIAEYTTNDIKSSSKIVDSLQENV
tara:strand:+ start:30458 stop:31366 length:909 start_codon:yes stop_codon:yes gene_type:complete